MFECHQVIGVFRFCTRKLSYLLNFALYVSVLFHGEKSGLRFGQMLNIAQNVVVEEENLNKTMVSKVFF
jgi:hypothetical protein